MPRLKVIAASAYFTVAYMHINRVVSGTKGNTDPILHSTQISYNMFDLQWRWAMFFLVLYCFVLHPFSISASSYNTQTCGDRDQTIGESFNVPD